MCEIPPVPASPFILFPWDVNNGWPVMLGDQVGIAKYANHLRVCHGEIQQICSMVLFHQLLEINKILHLERVSILAAFRDIASCVKTMAQLSDITRFDR